MTNIRAAVDGCCGLVTIRHDPEVPEGLILALIPIKDVAPFDRRLAAHLMRKMADELESRSEGLGAR